MKKLASLNGVKTLRRTAQKFINGGGTACVQQCNGQPRVYKGVCGGTPAVPCVCASPCAGGEVVNGICYICV